MGVVNKGVRKGVVLLGGGIAAAAYGQLKNCNIMSFLWFIIIGIVAGFIAGKLMHGGGFGVVINLIVGVVGGVLGGWLFSLLGISTDSIFGSLVTSVVGAVVLLWIAGLINRSISSGRQ